MTNDELKQKLEAEIEKYHQANYWNLFPAGQPFRSWALDAVVENVLRPMQDEIDSLKSKKVVVL